MPKASRLTSWLLPYLLFASLAGYPQESRDTIAPGKQKITRENNATIINGDIDEAIKSIDRPMEQLQHQDWHKMQQDMQKAMQNLNADAIQKQVQAALQQLDAQKIQLETQKALQKSQWQKMEQEVEDAIEKVKDNIDSQKLRDQLREALEASRKAMANIQQSQMDKIHIAMDHARTELKNNQENMQREIAKARKELKADMQRDWQKEMENARAGMKIAKAELASFKTMLSEMEQEGLLSIKDGYTVEYRDGKLMINGKEQPKDIADKYRHYFKKDNITLKKERDR